MGKILKAIWFKNKGNVLFTVLVILLGVGIVTIIPFVLIFALRLLGVKVAYSLSTWFGSLIILSIISGNTSSKGKD